MANVHLLSPAGFRAAGVYARIKTKHAPDVGLLVTDVPASAAAAFTTNKVFAAPVKIGRAHVAGGQLRAIVVNSGNANACTGRQGERDAVRMCQLAGEGIGCDPHLVLPSSTGIIGHALPMKKVERGIREAAASLGYSQEHANLFGDAIMTTDLKRKTAGTSVKIGRSRIMLAGVCKGSGMIGPRLSVGGRHATMLAYLTTDARIAGPLLKRALARAADASFNCVTVDDHASTNDTAAILASGASGVKIASRADLAKFTDALTDVCESLAFQIAADGEGATKVVEVVVDKASSPGDAQRIARAIANSPLVKCALHGNDPNWGRIVSAAGMCGAVFDPLRCELRLEGTPVFRRGTPVAFSEHLVSESLKSPEVRIHLSCNTGGARATVWTCDLSKEYVSINADYHT
jgi:glutamate N-acetyltransferase/amino-acid N-acetyltransferase